MNFNDNDNDNNNDNIILIDNFNKINTTDQILITDKNISNLSIDKENLNGVKETDYSTITFSSFSYISHGDEDMVLPKKVEMRQKQFKKVLDHICGYYSCNIPEEVFEDIKQKDTTRIFDINCQYLLKKMKFFLSCIKYCRICIIYKCGGHTPIISYEQYENILKNFYTLNSNYHLLGKKDKFPNMNWIVRKLMEREGINVFYKVAISEATLIRYRSIYKKLSS
jgi:hypothetical protein